MLSVKRLACGLALTVLAIGMAGYAQDAAAPPPAKPKPQAEPVLGHIPAGAMGFFVVNSVQNLLQSADDLAAEWGADKELGPKQPGRMAALVQGMAQLGPGFNPNGGFAAVMLDPTEFGVDLAETMGLKKAPPAGETAPAAEKPGLPWLMFIPGQDVAQVFPGYERTPAGKYTSVKLRMGTVLAVQAGGYIAISPSEKVLAAALGAQKMVLDEMAPDQAKFVKSSALAIHLNMKIASPQINQAIKQQEDQMRSMMREGGQAGMPPEAAASMQGILSILPLYREMLSSADSLTLSLRIENTGLLGEAMVAMSPDSRFTKLLTAYQAAADVPALLNRLPDLSYAAAFGLKGGTHTPETEKIASDLQDAMLNSPAIAKLGPEYKAKVKANAVAMQRQMKNVQVVVGQAPPQSKAVLGVGAALGCDDSAALKAALVEYASMMETQINAMAGDKPADQKGKIVYKKDALKLGDLSVDSIEIVPPKEIEEPAQKQENRLAILGDKKIEILLAAPDKTLVVASLGGGTEMLAQTIQTAKAAGGTIGQGPAAAESLKYMPANPFMAALVNVPNTSALFQRIEKVTEPGKAPPKVPVTTATPIALASAISGTNVRGSVFVPRVVIKEIIASVKSQAEAATRPAGAEGGAGGDPSPAPVEMK
ncbi:MAG: hypothetical protein LLG01_09720 [Planctomycetaceae bacterium]|nr:hypothetical protein [Planctomycetaceae bacterium]